jgi:lipopolysaccharide exporter
LLNTIFLLNFAYLYNSEGVIFKKYRSAFVKNTATLIGGTAIAQALPVLFAPVISRLFTAEDFNVYGIFVSIYAIVSSAVTLKYERAVMLPLDEENAKRVVSLSLISSVVFSLIVLILFLIFQSPIASLFSAEKLEQKLLLIPLAAFLLSVNNVFINWYNRIQKYKTIAANKIIRNGLLTFSNLGFGFLKSGSVGLIWSQIISDGIASLVYLGLYLKHTLHFKIRLRLISLKGVMKEYREFPLFTLPASILDTISMQLPILMIAALFSQSLSGNYFFSYRILALPISLIGAAFAQTFYQTFVSYIQNKSYTLAFNFLKKSWMVLFSLILIPAVILMIWGQTVFGFIFGAEWLESGKIASILILYIMFAFVSSPTSSSFIALGMQKYNLFFSISVITYRFGTLFTGYLMNDFYFGLSLLVCFELVEIVIYNTLAVRKLLKLQKSSSFA